MHAYRAATVVAASDSSNGGSSGVGLIFLILLFCSFSRALKCDDEENDDDLQFDDDFDDDLFVYLEWFPRNDASVQEQEDNDEPLQCTSLNICTYVVCMYALI